MEAIRVVVVDDHELFRSGLTEMLRARDIDVVGTAATGESALEIIDRSCPNVVLMDLNLPGMSGAQATAELTRAKPEIFVIMLTVAADEASVIEAILAGACGYLLKDAAIEEVVAAVRAGAHGESLITPRIATDLLRLVRAGSGAIGARRPQLTEREQEVLRLLIEGRDNAEIAQALFISPSTVKNHVSSILDKLDVDNRVQAAVRAVRDRLA